MKIDISTESIVTSVRQGDTWLSQEIPIIMNSAAYQLSSEANATNQSDNKYYSKYIVKRLSGEVLLDAMSQVTGVPSRFPGYAVGTRALQLPDTQVKSEFLTSFGRPARIICDAGERSSEPRNSEVASARMRAASPWISAVVSSTTIRHVRFVARIERGRA